MLELDSIGFNRNFFGCQVGLPERHKQVEHWRQAHPAAPDQIPTRLWDQAVLLATLLPRAQVAQQLHLNPTDLQERCLARQKALLAEAASPYPGFVEVTAAGFETPAAPQAAVIEVERPDGIRLRLQYQDAPPPATILRAFLEVAPCCS